MNGSPAYSDKITKWLLVIVLGGLLLYWGKPLFIPLAFALFIGFILYPICRKLESKGLSKGLSISLALSLLLVLGAALISVLYLQLIGFTKDWPFVAGKLSALIQTLKSYAVSQWGMDSGEVDQWSVDITHSLASRLFSFAEAASVSFFVNVVMLVLIPFYVFLLLVIVTGDRKSVV